MPKEDEKKIFADKEKNKAKEERVPIIAPAEFKENSGAVSAKVVFKGDEQISPFLKLAVLFRKPVVFFNDVFYIPNSSELYELRSR
ncbi:MAG: hypothetical protein QXV37_04555 [Candidatus Jordarchaeaceae archaeon]